MKKEIARITKLLEENKISKEEYDRLLDSLLKTRVVVPKDFLIDPFPTLSLWQSLLIGFFVLLLLSGLGHIGKIHFPGTFDLKLGVLGEWSFFKLAAQNLLILLATSIFFLLGGLICRCKNIRIIDVFASLSVARFPYIIATFAILFYIKVWGKNFETFDSSLFVIVPFLLISVVWLGILYYKALKFSLGCRGKILGTLFAFTMIFSEGTTLLINTNLDFDGTSYQKQLAIDQANHWLEFIDQKMYQDSWEATTLYFQKSVTKDAWTKLLKDNEGQIGTLESRQFLRVEMDKERGLISVLYNSRYSIMGDGIEKVVLRVDGKELKVEGYWLK